MWSREDWIWFVDDVRAHLTTEGRAVIKLNDKDYRTGLHPGSAEFASLMDVLGVDVIDRTITIRKAPS